MPNERDTMFQPLNVRDFDIADNRLRAYYDADDKLVMVLDLVASDIKPNVLLVMNPVGNRKWDDILVNDYGMDLETVRPKKDNRYQKLDIEYAGLAQYDNLIAQWQRGDDVSDAVRAVDDFRRQAARRAALERLGEAELTAERSRDTIEKTNQTISELMAKIKGLRAKLAAQRRDVGKEPTKQSAAKILRTESQIDAANDKLGRARKRLANAQKRLAMAEDEADIANDILDKLADYDDNNATENVPAMPLMTDVALSNDAPTPMVAVPQFGEVATVPADKLPMNPKAEEMADDEVKPLFDKDPEILDDEIAFKPIDFNLPTQAGEPQNNVPAVNVGTDTIASQPLTFVPPSAPVVAEPIVPVAPVADADEPSSLSVLDSLTPVALPSEQQDSGFDAELMVGSEPAGLAQPQPMTTPIGLTPVMPSEPAVSPNVAADTRPMPEIAPAPVGMSSRPVSPITGSQASTVTAEHRRPTFLYYVLLVALIVLSVFTLWMYQRSANKATPELGAEVKVVEEVAPASPAEPEPTPFIEPEVEEVVVAEPAPTPTVIEPVVADAELESVIATPAEPIAIAEETVADDVPVTAEPTMESVPATPEVPSPFLTDEEVGAGKIKTVAEIIASKPAYNVSQNEKMFVADAEYETDDAEYYDDPAPVVDMAQPTVVQEVAETCADGNAPDADGCCAGEELVDNGGEYMCCAIGTNDCFPPMF